MMQDIPCSGSCTRGCPFQAGVEVTSAPRGDRSSEVPFPVLLNRTVLKNSTDVIWVKKKLVFCPEDCTVKVK